MLCARTFRLGWAALLLGGLAVTGMAGDLDIQVEQAAPDRITIQYQFPEPVLVPVVVNGMPYSGVVVPSESILLDAGDPALPRICRSVIIPDQGVVAVRVLGGNFYEQGPLDVVPSKGSLPRTIDPATVPYTFGDSYSQNAFFPGVLAEVGEPYILRDYRGAVVRVYPYQYDPITRVLRVYTDMRVEVVTAGTGGPNVHPGTRSGKVGPSFRMIYERRFINHQQAQLRYNPLDEEGEMLVICHDAWIPNMQPLVTHKNQHGIPTTIVGVSTIGNNSTAIKNYIQNVYNSSDLAFVLLVGDSVQVATPSASGGAADPTYGKLAGGDNYPEAMIGRFSAENTTHVDTQVQRTIWYETLPATQQEWFWRGTGIASLQGSGIGDEGQADNVHMNEIRQWLLAYGYTHVDQIYMNYGGGEAQVAAALNEGRGIINYCGHGDVTYWVSSGFSNTNVNQLQNQGMLPFIISVACVNGQFVGTTCFGEAWLRASQGGVPTGAIAAYMSSINQSWAPPMEGQDEFNLLFTSESYATYGALCFAGSCSMMDDYASDGVNMFNTWHIFGDPSLRIVGVAGPMPPRTSNLTVETPVNTPITIALPATDDGLPDPPAAFTVTVTSLPEHGTLSDAGAGPIEAVPYTLVNNGTQVVYEPALWNMQAVAFTFMANDGGVPPEGGDSNVSTITVNITPPLPELVYNFDLDSDPGWSCDGLWAWGQPLGLGTHNRDPNAGYTGANVYGYNLSGDYPNNMSSPMYLTTPAFNFTEVQAAELRFRRWLGIEAAQYDQACIEFSLDGSTWTPLWEHAGGAVAELSWSLQSLALPPATDGQATVYFRWAMGSTDYWGTYPGWNLDDIQVWGRIIPVYTPGDVNCDGSIDALDISAFILALTNPAQYAVVYPDCDIRSADINLDGAIDALDINPFVQLLTR